LSLYHENEEKDREGNAIGKFYSRFNTGEGTIQVQRRKRAVGEGRLERSPGVLFFLDRLDEKRKKKGNSQRGGWLALLTKKKREGLKYDTTNSPEF